MLLRDRFVRLVYARHNRSPAIRRALDEVFAELDSRGGIGLDLGAGASRLHPRLLRLDRAGASKPDCLGSADRLPFADSSLAAVVSQEVFEHLPDPVAALAEVARVLAPGGLLYLQTPFVIGRHDAPHDYWRFTGDGLGRLLASAGFEVARVAPAVGAGTGFYRIAVEFVAVLASSLARRLYLPAKGVAALAFWPLRWLDGVTLSGPESWRIPGGFFALARKPL